MRFVEAPAIEQGRFVDSDLPVVVASHYQLTPGEAVFQDAEVKWPPRNFVRFAMAQSFTWHSIDTASDPSLNLDLPQATSEDYSTPALEKLRAQSRLAKLGLPMLAVGQSIVRSYKPSRF